MYTRWRFYSSEHSSHVLKFPIKQSYIFLWILIIITHSFNGGNISCMSPFPFSTEYICETKISPTSSDGTLSSPTARGYFENCADILFPNISAHILVLRGKSLTCCYSDVDLMHNFTATALHIFETTGGICLKPPDRRIGTPPIVW